MPKYELIRRRCNMFVGRYQKLPIVKELLVKHIIFACVWVDIHMFM